MNQYTALAPKYMHQELNEVGQKILMLLKISQEEISQLTKDQIHIILSLQKNRTSLDSQGNILVAGKGKSHGKLNLKRIQKHFQDVENSIQ